MVFFQYPLRDDDFVLSSRHIIRFNSWQAADGSGENLQCAEYYSDLAELAFPDGQVGELGGDVYATSKKFANLFEVLATDLSIPRQLVSKPLPSHSLS